MKRIIFHVDINSYFATMLQQENPALRGKPVGVIKGVGRTCIIASSNEAKKLGVETGSYVGDARKKAPHIILVPAHMDLMLSATRQLKALFHTLAPTIQIFSLDEVFLDLSGCTFFHKQRNFDTAHGDNELELVRYGKKIQAQVKQTLGEWVQCNVGISHNKLLAKLAGEMASKGSVFHITQENLDEILARARFKDVCGIGLRLAERLEKIGVLSPYHINLIDDETLLAHFGPHWASELRKIGRGEETHFFSQPRSNTYQKSVGRTITGYRPLDTETEIRKVLLNLLAEATQKLRKLNQSGRMVGVSLHGSHGEYWGDYKTLRYWVRHTDEIWQLLEALLDKRSSRFPVIKFGVWIQHCTLNTQIPQCLLPEWEKRERIYTAIDQVNAKYGFYTVRPATLVGPQIIKPEVTGYLGDKVYLGLA